MKKLLAILLLLFCWIDHMAQESDTIRINFCIHTSEFGAINEGLFVYQNAENLKAQYILYNVSSYGLAHRSLAQCDSLLSLDERYKDLPNRYTDPTYLLAYDSVSQHCIAESLIQFYNENKNNYIVLKDIPVLNKTQKEFIHNLLNTIKTYSYEKDNDVIWVSNAPDYYTVLSENEKYSLYDPKKELKKYIELRQLFDIRYPDRPNNLPLNIQPAKFSETTRSNSK